MAIIASQPKHLCDLCGATGSVLQTGISDPDGNLEGVWGFQRCGNPDCAVCWLDPAPPPEELWKAYASYHTHTRKSGARFAKATLSLAHRLLKLVLLPTWMKSGLKRDADALRFMTLTGAANGKLLDVGCGGGRFLRRMKSRGWSVEGTDFDEQATTKVTSKYGIKTYVGDLPHCQLQADTYDVITLSQTIEHLYDPLTTLRECLRILKPGGLLVMTTPNVESIGAAEFGPAWRGWEAPRHLHLFSVASLSRLTQRAGFNIDEARSYSAGSAVVYRVSRQIREQKQLSWLEEFEALKWGYRKELAEERAQTSRPLSGQNVLLRARKPFTS